MDRQLNTVSLPSGQTAKIVSFFTRGEVKNINLKKWGAARAVQKEDATIEIVDIPINQITLEDDAVVLNGTKFIGDVEFTENELDALSNEDFDYLLGELKPIYLGKKKKN